MHHDPTFHDPEKQRHIWNLPCVAIKVFLKYGMRTDTLKAFVQEHLCEPCAASVNDEEEHMLHVAHQACHSFNRLSARIEKQLLVRFRNEIRLVRESSNMALVRTLASSGCTQSEMVGYLWALQTDHSPWRQRFGRDLMMAFLGHVEPTPPIPQNIVPWRGHDKTIAQPHLLN